MYGNCTKCNTPLQQYTILSETQFETLVACPKCQAGVISQLHYTNGRVAVKYLNNENVPKRYWNAYLEDRHMHFKDSNYVLDGECGIYFIGESGVGKTHLTVAWLNYWLYHGRRCHYINWSDFMVKLRMDIKQYDEMKHKALEYDCIFIDDFDATNQYMYDIVYNFVNTLYNEPKITFFNSIELPTQSKLAMRIGEMTKQIKLVKGSYGD